MEKRNTDHLISRRRFIGSIMFATTGAAMISGCNTPRWQTGCFTRPWSAHDYRVAFDGIAGAGFKYVGLMGSSTGSLVKGDTTLEQAAAYGEEARSRDLIVASAYGQNFDVSRSVAEGIAGLEHLIDICDISGCPDLILGGISNPDLDDAYYKVIAECCDYAAEKGVRLNIKPHGNTIATGPQCRMRIEEVGHENFRLWYDPGNIYWYSDGEIDPVDDVPAVDGLVVGMCVKDFILPKDINVTPGNGMVDFPKVFAQLRQGGFTRGPLIVETLSRGDLAYTNEEAKKARLFLEELTG
jgi:sugar phosphate isomerase/epimerase